MADAAVHFDTPPLASTSMESAARVTVCAPRMVSLPATRTVISPFDALITTTRALVLFPWALASGSDGVAPGFPEYPATDLPAAMAPDVAIAATGTDRMS